MAAGLAESPTGTPSVGYSQWAAVASVVFLGLGVLIALFGIQQIVRGFLYDDVGGREMGYHILAMVVGGVLLAIGLLHLVIGRSIRMHRSSGRVSGIVVATLGVLLGVYMLPSALTLRPEGAPDVYALSISICGAAYAVALVGLVLGGQHFKRTAG